MTETRLANLKLYFQPMQFSRIVLFPLTSGMMYDTAFCRRFVRAGLVEGLVSCGLRGVCSTRCTLVLARRGLVRACVLRSRAPGALSSCTDGRRQFIIAAYNCKE
ncbi:hypothetical protein SEVIR_5G153200v4 [Setaria viridis]|uniref:Uncharacterized protein n=1 Tax=Setaria viridis TaxID=4556 RepID=A0A4U6UK27_SETVI|nr:hypothetical protein SEVIR_5G153200v2 [Setaria viridis]